MTVSPTARPSVVQLAIKEKAALYAAYIPLFAEGGTAHLRSLTSTPVGRG